MSKKITEGILCLAAAGCLLTGCGSQKLSDDSGKNAPEQITVTSYTDRAMGDESKKLVSYVSSLPDAEIRNRKSDSYVISVKDRDADNKIKNYIKTRMGSYRTAVKKFGKGQDFVFSGENGTIDANVSADKRKAVLKYINEGVGLLTVYRQIISATPGITVTVYDSATNKQVRSAKVYASAPFRY